MSGRPFALAVASALVVLSLAAPTRADDTRGRREARRLFDAGTTALTTGRLAEARDLFARSLALTRNVATAFNLGVALRGTGDALAAVRIFDELLDGGYGVVGSAQQPEVVAQREGAHAEIGTIVVRARGAERIEVRVDGERLGELADGDALQRRVNPGTRVVVASARAHRDAEARPMVERGARVEVELVLEPTDEARLGTLVVDADDRTAAVEIVGVAQGTGALRRQLDVGEYTVRVAGGESRTVRVTAGTTTRVHLGSGGSVLASPVFWVATAAGVAALTTLVVVLASGSPRDPIGDPVWGVTETLGAR